MNILYSHFSTFLNRLDIFETAPRISVGVSGGPDSLALTLLLNRWAQEKKGTVIALIVDHGLRPESHIEAQAVEKILRERGISSIILPWRGDKPSYRIQEYARLARYNLLETYCWEQGIFHLFIAHHREDQAETFIARLGKKSGLTGLCSMQPIEERWFGCLIRPLLHVSKEEMLYFLKSERIPFFIDPSNAKGQFERVRLRQNIDVLEKVNLTSKTIIRVVEKLQQANESIEERVSFAYLESVVFSSFGWVEISLCRFLKYSREIQYRLLESILQTLGGREIPLRSRSIERILDNIKENKNTVKTLSHCIIRQHGKILYIMREEKSLPNLSLGDIYKNIWGGFYYIKKKKEQPKNSNWEVRSLGRRGAEFLQKKGGFLFKYPSYLTYSFPSLWDGSILLSVPYLDFQREKWETAGLYFPVCVPHVPLTGKIFFPYNIP